MGSVGVQNQIIQPAPEVKNPQQDEIWHNIYDDARKYKGTIYSKDVAEYGKEYELPSGDVQMVKVGEWADGQSTWAFADGSHANLWFSRDRRGIYYLENINF